MRGLPAILFFALLGSAASAQSSAPLQGTIYVPSDDYPTPAAAANAISVRGVGSGGITVRIAPNPAGYEGQVRLYGRATGRSNRRIRFEKNPAMCGEVILRSSLSSVVVCDGADWCVFSGLKIEGENVSCFEFKNGARDNSILNCRLTLTSTNGGSTAALTTSWSDHNLRVQGCVIRVSAENPAGQCKGAFLGSSGTFLSTLFYGQGPGADDGLYCSGSRVTINHCTFYNWDYRACHINNGGGTVDNCTFLYLPAAGSGYSAWPILASHGTAGSTRWRHNTFSNHAGPGSWCFYVSPGYGNANANSNTYWNPNGASLGFLGTNYIVADPNLVAP